MPQKPSEGKDNEAEEAGNDNDGARKQEPTRRCSQAKSAP
jgi:hypothetical protein